MKTTTNKFRTLAGVAGVTLALMSGARAVSYSMADVAADGNPANVAVGIAQLFMDVTNPGSNQVRFTFRNTGPAASILTQIYFEDGATPPLSSIASVIDVDNTGEAGVDFEAQAGNLGRPPGSENLTPAWVNNATEFRVDPNNPSPTWGVGPGESLALLFNLSSLFTFQDVIDNLDLANNDASKWRVGMHVQGFADGGSDTFMTSVRIVNGNVPDGGATMALLGLSLLGMTAVRKAMGQSKA